MPKRHSAAETPPPGSKPTAWAKYRAVHRATRQEARASCDWREESALLVGGVPPRHTPPPLGHR